MLGTVIGCGLLVVGSVTTTAPADPIQPIALVAEAPVAEAPVEPAAVELVDMNSEMTEMANWALDLFDQAQLELPPMRFVHHQGDREPCRGRDGLHRLVDGVSVIEVCATEATFPTQVMILHETAHAWVGHQLTDERKAEFKDLRGWEHWRDYEAAAWHDNGTEQAAEIMVWGLIDRPLRMVRIYDTTCADLEAGYSTLTSEPPLHGFRDYC